MENQRLNKLDVVQNFKREFDSEGTKYLYQILDVAYHSESMEKVVVYKALYAPYETWVRPYDMFMSEVDKDKYPEVKQEYRFEKVEESVGKLTLCDKDKGYTFEELKMIIGYLRSEHGCPWDKKQTFESMKKCLRDESEEVFQAIDNKDMPNLCEELGDVLMQVVMNSQIARESNYFTVDDVIQGVSEKLIRRHPHVFGDEVAATTEEEALERWKAVKLKEKEMKNQSR